MHLNAGLPKNITRHRFRLPVSASLSLVSPQVPLSLVRACSHKNDDRRRRRTILICDFLLINLFVKGALFCWVLSSSSKESNVFFGSFLFFSILRRRFLSLLVLPTIIIERRRKERENNLIFTKGTNLKKNELITELQSQENVLVRFTDTFGREGVNDFET